MSVRTHRSYGTFGPASEELHREIPHDLATFAEPGEIITAQRALRPRVGNDAIDRALDVDHREVRVDRPGIGRARADATVGAQRRGGRVQVGPRQGLVREPGVSDESPGPGRVHDVATPERVDADQRLGDVGVPLVHARFWHAGRGRSPFSSQRWRSTLEGSASAAQALEKGERPLQKKCRNEGDRLIPEPVRLTPVPRAPSARHPSSPQKRAVADRKICRPSVSNVGYVLADPVPEISVPTIGGSLSRTLVAPARSVNFSLISQIAETSR